MLLNIKMRKFKVFCLSILLLIPGFIYSQFDYRLELEKRLCPKVDISTTKEVALFVSKPSFVELEYSIRIIDIGNQSFIEARILEKNLWHEQFNRDIQADSLLIKSYFYSASVSNYFRDKVVQVFSKIIISNENRSQTTGFLFFDGTCYDFKINDSGKIASTMIDYELKYSDFEYQVAMTNLRIVDALKRHPFNELVYQIYNEP